MCSHWGALIEPVVELCPFNFHIDRTAHPILPVFGLHKQERTLLFTFRAIIFPDWWKLCFPLKLCLLRIVRIFKFFSICVFIWERSHSDLSTIQGSLVLLPEYHAGSILMFFVLAKDNDNHLANWWRMPADMYLFYLPENWTWRQERRRRRQKKSRTVYWSKKSSNQFCFETSKST